MKKICLCLLTGFIFSFLQVNAQSSKRSDSKSPDTPPTIPVGLDAYRMWDQWPSQRIGARAYMRSTYDREGANQSVDASHFLFANEEDFNVSLDVKGKGVLYFVRTNHWHGSPWHYVVDGNDYIVKETASDDPVDAKEKFTNTTFLPASTFPQPLTYTWSTTKGADLMWVPIGFEESFRLAYSRTHYGTGYYIYKLYADQENLSQPIESWDIDETPDQEVVALLKKAGTDIAPQDIKKKSGKVKLNKERVLLEQIKSSPSKIRAFKIKLPMEKAIDLERLRLIATWDNAEYPSIDAPLCLFFGAGTLFNREEDEFLVQGFPINIRFDYDNSEVELACYYPMPFFKSAQFEIAGIDPDDTEISYEIRYEPLHSSPNHNSYFHATYKDMPNPELGKDLTFLDTQGMEGQDDWSGSFVGTSFIFSHNAVLGTLEGDPRFYFDDSNTPQAYGTGTEEWGGGGDYWGGRNMTLPFAGHPCGARNKDLAKNEKDLIQSAYRFLLADMMPFGKRARITFEHGGENLSTEHYESVTYWYGLPAPSLVKTDEINIGDVSSEQSHQYNSPQASEVETITSRYEWGIDTYPNQVWGARKENIPGYMEKIGKEIFPAHEENGRFTQGTTEFTVALDPENAGAILRRTLDYSFPNQTAEVYISKVSEGETASREQTVGDSDWEFAGIWYLAGSNTALYSDPHGELEKRLLRTKTSNRRFRDDEFLIPAAMTKNQSAIRVRIKFVPNDQKLFPDFPFPKESAWSELRYHVYSYIMPEFSLKK